jgi:hypothetical protein
VRAVSGAGHHARAQGRGRPSAARARLARRRAAPTTPTPQAARLGVAERVGQDRHAVDRAAALEMQLQLLGRGRVVDGAHVHAAAVHLLLGREFRVVGGGRRGGARGRATVAGRLGLRAGGGREGRAAGKRPVPTGGGAGPSSAGAPRHADAPAAPALEPNRPRRRTCCSFSRAASSSISASLRRIASSSWGRRREGARGARGRRARARRGAAAGAHVFFRLLFSTFCIFFHFFISLALYFHFLLFAFFVPRPLRAGTARRQRGRGGARP